MVLETRYGPVPLARLATWSGALFSLAAIGVAAWLAVGWAQNHPLAVPVGLPPSIIIAGWLGVLGLALTVLGTVLATRGALTRQSSPATLVGSLFTALCALGAFVFLLRLGAGPFG